MPTYEFHLNTTGRGGGTDEAAGQDLNLEYEVTVDDATVTADDVIAAALTIGVAKGVSHPSYAYAICTTVRAEPDAREPHRWTLTAVFKEPAPVPGSPISPEGGQPTPEDREPWVRGTFRRDSFIRTTDLDGRAFQNTAGDLLENPPDTGESVGILTVTRWYPSISYTALKAYENAVNLDAWQGFPADSLKIVGVDWEPKTERGWTGWRVQFTVEERKVYPEQLLCEGWTDPVTGGWIPLPVLNLGYRKKIAGGDDKHNAGDTFGQQSPNPIILTADGTGESTTPVYLGFEMFSRISFAILDP